MSEIERLVEEIRLSFEPEPWHGPSLMEILEGINAKIASAHPVKDAHSIWELVLHIAAWERAIYTRIAENRALQLSDEQNFPPVSDAGDATWQQALQQLRATHDQLMKTVSQLTEARLSDQVPGKRYDIRFMLHGAAQHAAYHGGQISLLKKFSH